MGEIMENKVKKSYVIDEGKYDAVNLKRIKFWTSLPVPVLGRLVTELFVRDAFDDTQYGLFYLIMDKLFERRVCEECFLPEQPDDETVNLKIDINSFINNMRAWSEICTSMILMLEQKNIPDKIKEYILKHIFYNTEDHNWKNRALLAYIVTVLK